MDIEKVKQAKTQEEARQFAMDWQHWITSDNSDQGLSWEEIIEWEGIFEILADKFDLRDEFTENCII